ncbi:MAG TPA: hypothetical protein DEV93_03530 [Chloroflexi bacterium]|jgi:hypothetical protein|nr:hypothetical protein [Chloroflexota bacterium]
MSYEYGKTMLKPYATKTTDEMRAELENLHRLRAAILAETEAKSKDLARIQAARKRLIPVATYAPTTTALAYRELFGHLLERQTQPIHGGSSGLRMAAAEAARYEARKREVDGPDARLGRRKAA